MESCQIGQRTWLDREMRGVLGGNVRFMGDILSGATICRGGVLVVHKGWGCTPRGELSTTAGGYPQIWGGYPQVGKGMRSLMAVVVQAVFDGDDLPAQSIIFFDERADLLVPV